MHIRDLVTVVVQIVVMGALTTIVTEVVLSVVEPHTMHQLLEPVYGGMSTAIEVAVSQFV